MSSVMRCRWSGPWAASPSASARGPTAASLASPSLPTSPRPWSSWPSWPDRRVASRLVGARRKPTKTAGGKGQPRALGESRAQHAGTAEILGLIATSGGDVQPVFEAIVARAAQLCGATFSQVARFEGGLLHLVAVPPLSAEERAAYRSLFPRPPI